MQESEEISENVGEVCVVVIYINFYINSEKMFSYLISKAHYVNKKK